MKRTPIFLFLFLALALAPLQTGLAQENNLSIKLEVQRAIEKGLLWLEKAQDNGGFWGDETQPALTALALTAYMGDPQRKPGTSLPPYIEKGYEFVGSKSKDDGGIYGKGLACYNTSLCVQALLYREDKAYRQLALNARKFLINQQSDFDFRGQTDNKYDGGVGYGGTYAHSDLSNTHFVLEALYHAESLFVDTGIDRSKTPDLNWAAAIKFVERCQNLPETNDQDWASDDPANKGGFIYFPGDSKAGEQKLKNGKTALRSYGSMSYAGLLSLVYAKMDQNDPRIKAVIKWLQENYSIEENPGLGAQGLFYYYHSMAKALNICGLKELTLKDGKKVDWRKNLAKKLFDLQDANGSWANQNGRWWEKDPVLATCYAVLALEHLHRSL